MTHSPERNFLLLYVLNTRDGGWNSVDWQKASALYESAKDWARNNPMRIGQGVARAYNMHAALPSEGLAWALALLRSSGDAGLMIGATSLSAIADTAGLEAAFGSASLLLLGAGAHFAIRAKEPARDEQLS